jgi:hypothetical protein
MQTIFTNIADARDLSRGTEVAFVYNGKFRRGKIEQCDHPTVITLQTGDPAKPYKSFTRSKIENTVPC